jgi:hypothetical protein
MPHCVGPFMVPGPSLGAEPPREPSQARFYRGTPHFVGSFRVPSPTPDKNLQKPSMAAPAVLASVPKNGSDVSALEICAAEVLTHFVRYLHDEPGCY